MAGLDRFVAAQAQTQAYARALAELQAGRKQGHWIWFVFPQIAGLGRSETARFYAIRDLAEAQDYLAHPLLGARLDESGKALLPHAGTPIAAILGEIDAVKLRSSMTLFEAAGGGPIFGEVLDAFHEGQRDPATLARLGDGRGAC